MSDMVFGDSHCKHREDSPCASIKLVLEPRDKDLGSFSVRRLLPTKELRAVGPFIFFDHLGPAVFAPGEGIDVRPHPHIGLATITYVFEGEILHRDSLGKVQQIRPNEINWMKAGRGIAHSERTPPGIRRAGHTLHALQLWIALPEEQEETQPLFAHYGAEALPAREEADKTLRVMVGEAFGLTSPVKTHSPTLYVEVQLKQGARLSVPDSVEERAVYVVAGSVAVGERIVGAHHLAVFDETPGVELSAGEDSRIVLIGGSPLGKRTLWWNLVATRAELIEAAKQGWRDGTFPRVPQDEDDMPLPE